MIWSVSTSARSSGSARPCTRVTGSISVEVRGQRERAQHRGGRGDRGRNEVRASARPLTPLEVAVRGRGAALARTQDVRVHAEAHGAAGRPPLEARVAEDAIETLALGLLLDASGAGNDERVQPRPDASTGED